MAFQLNFVMSHNNMTIIIVLLLEAEYKFELLSTFQCLVHRRTVPHFRGGVMFSILMVFQRRPKGRSLTITTFRQMSHALLLSHASELQSMGSIASHINFTLVVVKKSKSRFQ